MSDLRKVLLGTARIGLAWGVSGFAVALGGQALAQIAPPSTTVDAVVVTGTRIANPNLASSSPISTISSQDVKLSGNSVSIDRVLNDLPQFSASHTGTTSVAADSQLISTADLRGLGPQRTLVLVDGARFVPSNTSNQVDLNVIPSALVERIDVVTGGASAVYGSDAIAGVVNFVLKRNFQGVEMRASNKIDEAGDGRTSDAGLTIGGDVAGGRGNVVMDISYSQRNQVLGGARDWATNQLQSARCAPGTVTGKLSLGTASSAADSVPCYTSTGSGTLAGGTLNNNIVFDTQGNAISPRPAGLFLNFFPDNYLQLPLSRWTAGTLARYALNDRFELYARVFYTGLDTSQNQQATSTNTSQFPPVQINYRDNPFVKPSLAALLAPLDPGGTGIATVTLSRRMLETGPRTITSREDALQVQTGLKGDISSNWKFDIYYARGQDRRTDVFKNDITSLRLQQALLARTGPDGRPVCLDPSNGCVPANIFGAGNVSAAAANFLRTDDFRKQEVVQQIGSAYVSGNTKGFIELPAGPIDAVAGLEWRDVRSSSNPDFVLQQQSIGYTLQLPTSGGYNVKEVYGEFVVPLLADMPLAKSLSVKGAARYSDYSLPGVGGVVTWNAGAVYEPLEGVRLRAELQHAIRAPNVVELFGGRSQQTVIIPDPCSNRSAASTRTPQLTALCIATGVPAANVFGNLQPGSAEFSQISGGNPNLAAEESDTFTVGGTFRPSVIPGFQASIDYYRIDIAQAIGLFGGSAANIVNLCYSTLRDANSIYCKAIVRDPITGAPQQVLSKQANVAAFKTSGVDFEAMKSFDLPFGLWGNNSRFGVTVRGTYTNKKVSQSEAIADTLDCVGLFGSRCGEPTPQWNVNSTLTWVSGPATVRLNWRRLSALKWDGQYVFPNTSQGVAGSFTPSTALGSSIGAYNLFAVSSQWTFPHGVQLAAGVNNLLDRDPPIVAQNGRANNSWLNTYDPLGRQYFVGLTVKF